MPRDSQAVNAIEYDGDTDSGDSADMQGDEDSVLAELAPSMYFESSEVETASESESVDRDTTAGDGLGEDAEFEAEICLD